METAIVSVEVALFDVILAVLLPTLALRLLTIADLFYAVVLFIVFGLLMAVAWSRLRAPDVALAEAAIGAGLTGILFMDALRRLGTFRTGLGTANHRSTAMTEHAEHSRMNEKNRN